MSDDDKHWHVDRRVPIVIIGGILLQTFTMGWWASGINERIGAVERDALKTDNAASLRISTLETRQMESDKLSVRVDERLRSVGETLIRVEAALKPRTR